MKSGYLFRGVLLVIAGALLLMANFGYLKPTFWWQLIQLWPVMLIALGIRMIGKDIPYVDYLVILLIFGVIGYAAWGSYTGTAAGPKETIRFKQQWTDGIDEMDLTVNFGDGSLIMGSGDTDLILGDLDYYADQPGWDFELEGNRGTLEISQEEFPSGSISMPWVNRQGRRWSLDLHREPIWSINMNSGACDIKADLRDISIRDMEINTGASNVEVRMGELVEDCDVVIKAGASNIKLYFPERTSVKINLSGALSSDNLEEIGFEKNGDTYYSPFYGETEFNYEVDISVGVSNVDVLFY